MINLWKTNKQKRKLIESSNSRKYLTSRSLLWCCGETWVWCETALCVTVSLSSAPQCLLCHMMWVWLTICPRVDYRGLSHHPWCVIPLALVQLRFYKSKIWVEYNLLWAPIWPMTFNTAHKALYPNTCHDIDIWNVWSTKTLTNSNMEV